MSKTNEQIIAELKTALQELDTLYDGVYQSPESVYALRKTIQSFNITITDWNTLLTYINSHRSSLDGLLQMYPNFVDAFEEITSNLTTEINNLKTNKADNTYVQTSLNLKENHSNKTSSITASSTDDQYPTAKSVYNKIKDVEDGYIIAGKAEKDSVGNVIHNTYETKSEAAVKLTESKEFAVGLVESESNSRMSEDTALDLAKINKTDIEDSLTSTSTSKVLSANMGKVIKEMIDEIHSILTSEDTDLDTVQEIVTFIKNNKDVIDTISTSKINYTDIIDNLTSDVSNKPVSAKQAYVLKGLLDNLTSTVNTKANSSDVYLKSVVDNLLFAKADKSTTYSKDDIDEKIHGMVFAEIDSTLDIYSDNVVKNKVISRYLIGETYRGLGTIANGCLQIDGTTWGTGASITISVEEGDTYLITGMQVTERIPLYLYLDSNDQIISYSSLEARTYRDYELTIPAGVSKLVVNCEIISTPSADRQPARLYIRQPEFIRYPNQVLQERIDRKQDKLYEWTDMSIVINTGYTVRGSGKKVSVVTSQYGLSYVVINYNANNKYKFSGVSNSPDYPVLIFTDENDFILGWWQSDLYTPVVDVEVDIPYDTKKIYINGSGTNNIKVKEEVEVIASEKQDLLVSGENIKTIGGKSILGSGDLPIDMSMMAPDVIDEFNSKVDESEFEHSAYTPLNLEILQGWAQSNGSIYTSGKRVETTVNAGDIIYVSGQHINATFPLYVMYDAESHVVSTYGGGPVTKVKVTIPNNVVKIAVNGETGQNTFRIPTIYTLQTVTTTVDDMNSSIENKQSKELYYNRIGTISNGYAVNSSGKVNINTQFGGYVHTVFDYDPNKKYRLTFVCKSTNIPALVFANDQGYITGQSAYGSASDVDKVYVDLDLDPSIVPGDTTKIYVNGFVTSGDYVGGYVKVGVERSIASKDAGKIGVFFGDSVTYGTKIQLTPYRCAVNSFPEVVGKLLDIVVYNAGLGGGTYNGGRGIDFPAIAQAVVSGDFSTVYTAIESILSSEAIMIKRDRYDAIRDLDFSKVDFIVINYGINNYFGGSTLASVKQAMIDNISAIMSAYPQLKVYVMTPIYGNGYGSNSDESCDTWLNDKGLKLRDYADLILETAEEMHLPSKDLLAECSINAYNYSRYLSNDKIHPNVTGHEIIAEIVAKFIESN